ncbi:MAG: SDR family NAD(P)-dependent oxidoreductase [Chloroflexi bacterium]|nr:MAG: SDR family NAD(P)-dependent oxidoreductase [Chloroflexota bacterium]
MKLKDKVALISGATSGMGRGIAKLFAKEGASVVISGRSEVRGNQAVDEIRQDGGEATFIAADISKADEVEQLVQQAVEKYSKINILVPNAGILGIGSITEVSLETWDQTIGTNLNGVFYLCRFAIPEMIKTGGGEIVINASIAGFKAFPNHPAYCASKGALISLTRNLAIDYANHRIRVNCLCPGPIDTPLIWDSAKAFANPATVVQEVGNNTLMKRLGTPGDVAKAALFLASNDSSWITGIALTIDGGVMTGQ